MSHTRRRGCILTSEILTEKHLYFGHFTKLGHFISVIRTYKYNFLNKNDLAFCPKICVWKPNIQNPNKNVRFSNVRFAGQCLGMKLNFIVLKRNYSKATKTERSVFRTEPNLVWISDIRISDVRISDVRISDIRISDIWAVRFVW